MYSKTTCSLQHIWQVIWFQRQPIIHLQSIDKGLIFEKKIWLYMWVVNLLWIVNFLDPNTLIFLHPDLMQKIWGVSGLYNELPGYGGSSSIGPDQWLGFCMCLDCRNRWSRTSGKWISCGDRRCGATSESTLRRLLRSTVTWGRSDKRK